MTFEQQATEKTIAILVDKIQDANVELMQLIDELEYKFDQLKAYDYKRVQKAISAMQELNYALGLIKNIDF
jgi:hypothetical protein